MTNSEYNESQLVEECPKNVIIHNELLISPYLWKPQSVWDLRIVMTAIAKFSIFPKDVHFKFRIHDMKQNKKIGGSDIKRIKKSIEALKEAAYGINGQTIKIFETVEFIRGGFIEIYFHSDIRKFLVKVYLQNNKNQEN